MNDLLGFSQILITHEKLDHSFDQILKDCKNLLNYVFLQDLKN